jgi:hypothetical protein
MTAPWQNDIVVSFKFQVKSEVCVSPNPAFISPFPAFLTKKALKCKNPPQIVYFEGDGGILSTRCGKRMVFNAASMVMVAEPVPGEALGGFSAGPLRVAV